MSYRFMQISDIGFNSSLCRNLHINEYVEILRRKAFENLINICIKEKVTALLVCGNLYDEENITVESVKVIKRGFAKLKAHNIAIILAHGFLDKGLLLKAFLTEVIDFQKGFVCKEYSLPYDIDSITFVGTGYETDILAKVNSLNLEKTENISVGLLYINKKLYDKSKLKIVNDVLKDTKIHYWALGGESSSVKPNKDFNFGYSGFAVPVQGNDAGCLLVEINNKGKMTSKLFPICNVAFKNLIIDGLDDCNDVYIVIQKCVYTIQENTNPGMSLIASIKLFGPCKCYSNVVSHLGDIENQISKITNSRVEIDVTMLYKSFSIEEDKNNLNDLLKECYQLYEDDELYNKMVERINQKKVFYSKGVENLDKKQILEGLDSILIESALKEDINEN